MLRYLTSGESHGTCLMGILEGMPSGVEIKEDRINADLARRQAGYGRGDRQKIENDKVEIHSGILKGVSTGAPIGLIVKNKDNTIDSMPDLVCPRPGHADLAGSLKYDTSIRAVLERASARSTAVHVAIGAICKLLLVECRVRVASHVIQVGAASISGEMITFEQIEKAKDTSKLNCVSSAVEEKMIALIDEARENGDTLGGVIEIRVKGLPAGIGSHVQPDRKLDGQLAQALMSMQAIKAVGFGLGWNVGYHAGSYVHDPIAYNKEAGYHHISNNAGGIEGGMSNGEEVVVRIAKKPISTLKNPLPSVDMKTKKSTEASYERSDTCAIAACSVIAEAAVAFEVARALLEKTGGDSLAEIKRNLHAYKEYLKTR
ncbi:MAG: chorismate synthase [Candidatus Omnitrophica bacterium]|nr:chorismate synthase [Candidatus Omnitrophota bacterium]